MKTRNLSSLFIATFTVMSLTGCDWVDSAGGGEEEPSVTLVFLDDTPADQVNTLAEQSLVRIITSRRSAVGLEQTFTWSEEPLEQGNLAICAEEAGYDATLAAGSLAEACKAGTDCVLDFEPVAAAPEPEDVAEPDSVPGPVTDDAEFSLRIPALDASIGVRFVLSVEDSSGAVFTNEYGFCLIAINDSPTALDDTFVILEGSVLDVTPATVNLLSNDSDDTDVSNSPLSVLPEPLSGPEHATFFELGNDGSFSYQSSLRDLREDQFDEFVYQLTDGLSISTATATIRVVAANQAPRLVSPIPALSATEDELFTVDLSENFSDPENVTLTYALSPLTPLPAGSGLALSEDGVLSGIPTAVDVGRYELTVIVSDGGRITEADFSLDVAESNNRPPVFVTSSLLPEYTVPRLIILRITPRFTDPDNDRLTYSMAGNGTLPEGLSINPATGIISGRPREAGVYENLRVRATDPNDATALSSLFSLTVVDI